MVVWDILSQYENRAPLRLEHCCKFQNCIKIESSDFLFFDMLFVFKVHILKEFV